MSLIETLASIRPSSTFVTLKGYTSAESGEVADYQIVFHMSYGNALERSLSMLEGYIPADDLEAQAKVELVNSYQASLDKVRSEPLEIIGEHYDRVLDSEGTPIKGIKIHKESGALHMFGLLHRKTVITPGTFKPTKKRPLTVAKDKLRKLCPVDRFRQFIVKPGQVAAINVENLSLLPE